MRNIANFFIIAIGTIAFCARKTTIYRGIELITGGGICGIKCRHEELIRSGGLFFNL